MKQTKKGEGEKFRQTKKYKKGKWLYKLKGNKKTETKVVGL